MQKEIKLYSKYIYITVIAASLLIFALSAGGYLIVNAKTITLEYDNTSLEVKFYGDVNVAEVFQKADIELNAFDKVSPSMDTQLKNGDTVSITRGVIMSGTPYTQALVANAFAEVEKANEILKETQAEQQKKSGYSYRGQEEIKSEITDASIEVNGTLYTYNSVVSVMATAYCPCSICCGSWANGITADGSTAVAGYTVAAPPEFAFGTKLYIPYFDRVFEVQDRGGAITDMHIDIYFDTHEEALRFGVKTFEIYILN